MATLTQPEMRNSIGTHNGPYSLYRAVTVAKEEDYIADMKFTEPAVTIGPFPSWSNPDSIVAMDPWGHTTGQPDGPGVTVHNAGVAVQPSIAISAATLKMPEVAAALQEDRLRPGGILGADGVLKVIKCAVDPVWYLPGIAKRFRLQESDLRRKLFEQTGGM